MTDSIAHRGPDGEGWFREKNVGLGHRRLAILDLSTAGHQPMVTSDNRFALTFNGEIYNHVEVREVLEGFGHRFNSRTDSEVVLHAWAQWGSGCLSHFNGMFAFAVWDSVRNELFLVRDRYGIKPVYYSISSAAFVFGSEQRSVLEHPLIGRDLDKEAIWEYFTFQNIFTDRTFNKGIRILPAGRILCLNVETREIRISQYWDFDFREPVQSVDDREYEEELDRLLRQAVSRQLLADVEVGSYLSGGLDSGTLTALASRESSNMKTFTCGFDLSSASGMELGFDERAMAEAMSALFKTEHYEVVLKSGDMERSLERVVRQIEEPRVGQSYPNYYIARLASKFVKVVLSGSGGDELFGGYPWRYFSSNESCGFNEFVDRYYKSWHRLVDSLHLTELLKPIRDEASGVETIEIFRSQFSKRNSVMKSPSDFINESLYLESKTFLHGLLVVEDKLSMVHSLETRVPFLDNDLVDFAIQCPARLKVGAMTHAKRLDENDVKAKGLASLQHRSDGKFILRRAMARTVPSSVANGVKRGFSSPDASWFQGESLEFVKKRLGNKSLPIFEIVDFRKTQELVGEHLAGKVNRRLLIWSLLSLSVLVSK